MHTLPLYTLYTPYTLYTLFSLSPLYTLYTLYTHSSLYTLYTDRKYAMTCMVYPKEPSVEKIGLMVNYCAGAADYAIDKIAKYVRELCYLVQDNSDLYMEFPTVDVASKLWKWVACSRGDFCKRMGGEKAIADHLCGSDVNLLKAVGKIMTGMLMD